MTSAATTTLSGICTILRLEPTRRSAALTTSWPLVERRHNLCSSFHEGKIKYTIAAQCGYISSCKPSNKKLKQGRIFVIYEPIVGSAGTAHFSSITIPIGTPTLQLPFQPPLRGCGFAQQGACRQARERRRRICFGRDFCPSPRSLLLFF